MNSLNLKLVSNEKKLFLISNLKNIIKNSVEITINGKYQIEATFRNPEFMTMAQIGLRGGGTYEFKGKYYFRWRYKKALYRMKNHPKFDKFNFIKKVSFLNGLTKIVNKGYIYQRFNNMSFSELFNYRLGYNFYLSNSKKEGILIGYLDLEPSPEKMKLPELTLGVSNYISNSFAVCPISSSP